MSKQNLDPKQKQRLEDAQENLNRFKEKAIQPVVNKHRDVYSTAGKWQKSPTRTATLTRDEFVRALRKVSRVNPPQPDSETT